MLTLISSLWYVLFPAAALGAVWTRVRQLRRAAQTGLVRAGAWRRLRWALVCCGGFMLLTLGSVFYETALWLPALAGLCLAGMAYLVRAARPGVHPGLNGFRWPMPADGLELIARERTLLGRTRRVPWRWWLWRLAPAAPLLGLVLLAASWEARRWLVWLALGGSGLAPAMLVATRRGWLSPLSLLLASAALAWHAASLRAQLPPGQWRTPWGGARCAPQLHLVRDGTAWCLNPADGGVYHYQLATGLVLEQYQVADASQVFAANSQGAWIKQNPSGGLVHLGSAAPQFVKFRLPEKGAVTDDDELWLVDGFGRLFVYSAGSPPVQLTTHDGLHTSIALAVEVLPDQSVWLGLWPGASRRDPESGQWHSHWQQSGLTGPVVDIAAAPDGTVWLLHLQTSASADWWLSALRPAGDWLHVNLTQLTGLDTPRSRDAMAVDGLGRPWVAATSVARRDGNFLAVLNPDGTLAYPVFALGRAFRTELSGLLGRRVRLDPHGVLADGHGGIYLYNGYGEPLRQWRP